jgi:hypothetical protein
MPKSPKARNQLGAVFTEKCPLSWKSAPSTILLLLLAAACSQPPANTGRAQPTYNEKTGVLERVAFDSNGDGTIDAWSYMDGARVLRIELDTDADGLVDRWEHYDEHQALVKVGLSRANDGVEDAWAYQHRVEKGEHQATSRIEVSTRRDGTIDRIEYYEDDILARVEEDTNGDGRFDRWETWEASRLTSVAFDTNGTGQPTRRLVYGPDGNLLRVETESGRMPPRN